MRIVIFSPTVQASAIARMVSLVVKALVSQGHRVTLVRAEHEAFLDQPTHEFDVEMIPWNEHQRVQAVINGEVDALVYQIGNYYGYHKGCVEWLPKYRGIVCLHDFFLGSLFAEWSEKHRVQAMGILERWYGAAASESFYHYSSSETFIDGTNTTSPMTEWICSFASGVITHSNWGIARVLQSCPGPVSVVPLAYDAPGARISSERPLRTRDGFNILTIGHVNANKRAESIIAAISASSLLRDHAVYRLVGAVSQEMSAKLTRLADAGGVKLIISGEVTSEVLVDAIQSSDVICCLRWPSLEAASASAIEALLYGIPTIVMDTSFYSELPDHLVLKVDPGNEIAGIRNALEKLFEDPKMGHTMGALSQVWARETFSADNYARRLCETAAKIRKTIPAIAMTAYFASVLHSWGETEDALSFEETLRPLAIFE